MKKIMKKALSAALCAAMLTGSSAALSLSADAYNGPMPTYEDQWGYKNCASLGLYALNENGYFEWEWTDQGRSYVNYKLFNDGNAYNEVDAEKRLGYQGAYYDAQTNTLTLTNVKEPLMQLEVTSMGEDFKLVIEGECELACIDVFDDYMHPGYSGLTIAGTGHLVLNKNDFEYRSSAILFRGEESPAKLTLGKSVNIEMYGSKNGNDEDNDYSEKMKHSVIAWYGSTITDSSVLKAENGQKIDVSNEPIWEYEKIKGLYVNKDSRNYSIFYAHNEKDPFEEGVYGVSSNLKYANPGESIYYYPEKYYYIERFDAYMTDPDYYSDNMSEEQFKEAGYSLDTYESQKKIDFYDPDHLDENWHYSGYQLTNEEDPEGIYSISQYIYGKTEEQIREQYPIQELSYNEETKQYSRVNEDGNDDRANEAEFEEKGYFFIDDGEGNHILISIPVPDKPNSRYVYYLIGKEGEDTIYGIDSGFYREMDPDVNYMMNKLTLDEESGKYIIDPDFDLSMNVEAFEQSPYEYIIDEFPEEMTVYGTESAYRVCVDENGKKYALGYNSEGEAVYSFSEDDKIVIGEHEYYALTPSDVDPKTLTERRVYSDTVFDHFVYGDYLKYEGKSAPLANLSTMSADTTVKSRAVQLIGRAEGGTEPYKYAFMYKSTSASSWKVIGTKFGDKSTASLSLKTVGTYDVLISIKDAAGKTVAKKFKLTVNDVLNNTSTISGTNVNVGVKVTISGKAEGGVGPYYYTYQYSKPGTSKWITLGEKYGTAESAQFTAKLKGDYNARVLVKDSAGTIKTVSFTVTSGGTKLVNQSTIDKTSVSSGEQVKITAKASGGSSPYTYTYEIKKPGASSWSLVGKRNTSISECTFVPTLSGKYEARVLIKDANALVVSKNFTVNVTA